MKVIQFYKSETQLIKKAKKRDRNAQRQIYERYAPKMLSVCRRYISDIHYAEDVMIDAFMKVFTHLDKFRFQGSFEGWIRRIMINQSISFLRSKKQMVFTEDLTIFPEESWVNSNQELEVEEIQQVIDNLPDGYKMVFMLYAIEGYKHAEIADMLGISESTSKSQLFKARKMLQKKVMEQNNRNHGAFKI